MVKRLLTLLVGVGCMYTIGHGQSQDFAPVTQTYALTNAMIVKSPSDEPTLGTLVLKDGLIQAATANANIPGEARVIDLDSMYVYAGFISGLSYTGLAKGEDEEEGSGRGRRRSGGEASYKNAGIQPHLSVMNMLDPEEKGIADLRKQGFTAVHVVPKGRMLPGQGALILLEGEKARDMVYAENTSTYAQFVGGNVYPTTTIGVMARFRELYRNAELSQQHSKAYAKAAVGVKRPQKDEVMEALYPAVNKTHPIFFRTNGLKDVYRAVQLQKDLGFSLVLSELEQGWDLIDMIKSNKLPVLLSMDLPEIEEEKKKKEGEEEKEMTSAEMEMKVLKARKKEEAEKYLKQAGMFAEAGIPFAFSTLKVKAKDVHANVKKMMEHGLSSEAALAALTTNAASLLGLSSTMGTVEKGKIANLVISDKPIFEEGANIRYVFVDGKQHEFEAKKKKEKKEGDPDAEAVNPVGSWSYTAESPQGPVEGTMEITGEPGAFEGNITNSMLPDELELTSVEVNGDQLSVEFVVEQGGQSLTITIDATIDGDSFDGTLSFGEFGSAEIEGERTPEK